MINSFFKNRKTGRTPKLDPCLGPNALPVGHQRALILSLFPFSYIGNLSQILTTFHTFTLVYETPFSYAKIFLYWICLISLLPVFSAHDRDNPNVRGSHERPLSYFFEISWISLETACASRKRWDKVAA